ncbi:MAG TPA: c-type cytochrome [Gammaproteobacteria bacterium]|nr:c-type cytochrome [Gammaproteobacteria bacterium]
MGHWKFLILVALAVTLTGCGGEESYNPDPGTDAATMFAHACSHCHGKKGQGKFGFLLSLEDLQLPKPGIEKMIAHGNAIMPAFKHLSDAQRKQLADYVKTF